MSGSEDDMKRRGLYSIILLMTLFLIIGAIAMLRMERSFSASVQKYRTEIQQLKSALIVSFSSEISLDIESLIIYVSVQSKGKLSVIVPRNNCSVCLYYVLDTIREIYPESEGVIVFLPEEYEYLKSECTARLNSVQVQVIPPFIDVDQLEALMLVKYNPLLDKNMRVFYRDGQEDAVSLFLQECREICTAKKYN